MFKWWKTRQFHKAASRGDVITLRNLIHSGGDPNAPREYGLFNSLAPLHVAILHRSLPVVETLLDSGVNIDATCSRFSPYANEGATNESECLWTSLHLAVEVGQVEIIKKLCARGLDVDIRTSKGKTPLHYCAQVVRHLPNSVDREPYLRSMTVLIELRADVNARDNRGQTPLFYASCTNGCSDAVRTLLDSGADLNALDNSGQNALFWADGEGVVELLIEQGIDHRVCDIRGWTALKCARLAGIHVHKVKILEGLQAPYQ